MFYFETVQFGQKILGSNKGFKLEWLLESHAKKKSLLEPNFELLLPLNYCEVQGRSYATFFLLAISLFADKKTLIYFCFTAQV